MTYRSCFSSNPSHTYLLKSVHGSISSYLGDRFSMISEAASTQAGVRQIVVGFGGKLVW